MKITYKARVTALIPTTQYGNITCESTVEAEGEGDPDELRKATTAEAFKHVREQREVVDSLPRKFFSL